MNILGFGTEWFLALGSILLVNLLLSGDNAVVIALASKNLAPAQRNKAIFWGSVGAVGLRVVLTLAAATLLDIPYLQAIGGLALLWVAVSLLDEKEEGDACTAANSLKEAVKVILFADMVMSMDNVIALAAIAQTVPSGKYALIITGLATSIPLVVLGAQMLMKLMDRYPVIIYIGAAILGYAASEMILGDKAIGHLFSQYHLIIMIAVTAFPVVVGYLKKSLKGRAFQGRDVGEDL